MTVRLVRRLAMVLALGVVVAVSFRSDTPPDEASPDQRLAGRTVLDPNGRARKLSTLAGRRGTVIVFTGIDCPIGNLYMPRLTELAARYGKQGVAFLGVNA